MSFICRLCSSSDFDKIEVTDIFGSEGIKHKLPSKINELANILIAEDDPLPNYVCMECISKMDMVLAFHEQCRQAQAALWKEYISTCCVRASRLRKDVRVGTHYKHADALVQKAVCEGVDVKNLRECLQQAVEDLFSKTPIMLKQLALEPAVPLERCCIPTASNAVDEIEEALPVFCITRAAVAHRENSPSDDSDDQVLTHLWDKVSAAPDSCRSAEDRDKELGKETHAKRSRDKKSDNTKANNKAAGSCYKEMAAAVDENAINCDKEMQEAIGKQTSDNCKRNTAVGLGDGSVDRAQDGKEDSSCESPGSDDMDCTTNMLEITEFVDVGIFNDEVVRVNNEVKVKEEEEPLLEFTEPEAVFHEQAVGGVFKPLKKTTKHRRERACPSSRKKRSRQPLVDAKPIKLEPAPTNDLLKLVLMSNSKSKYDESPTVRRNALVQLLESNSTARQPAVVDRAEIVSEVPQSSQVVAYSHAACQTNEECPKAEAYQQTSKWPSIEVPVSRAKSMHYVFDNTLQPSQAIAAAHLSCSIRPPAPPTHGFASGRQLPVSRVQPLTANMHSTSQENLHESQNFGGTSLGAQPMSPNQISASLLHGPRPVAQSYPRKRQLNDVGALNVVQYSRAADVTTSVVGMQQNVANVEAILGTQHPVTSIHQVINNSQPTISVVNHSSLVNVLPVPSNQQPTTSFQHVISKTQPTISVVNHSLLSNVRIVPSIQQPTTSFQHFVSNSQPTISVVNHSSPTNARSAPITHHPTTSFQHISNSQPAFSVVNHSSPANVRPVPSIHHPTTNFQHVISNSQPAVSVGDHSSPVNVQSVPSIHHPTTSFQQVISNTQPTISVVKHSSLANVRTVPSIQNPTPTSFQSLVKNAQSEMLVANHSSPTNVREIPSIPQPIISFQRVTSTSQPSFLVENPSSLTSVRTVSGIQQPTTSFQHVSNSQPSISVVNPSTITNVRTVSNIQQPAISFQHHVSNSQPSISVVNPSSLTNVRTVSDIQQQTISFPHHVSNAWPSNPSSLTNVRTVSGIQQPTTSFQHHVNNSQPVNSVVNRSSPSNVRSTPSIHHPTTSFQHVSSNSHPANSLQPIISVKNFSRMNVDPVSQNSYSDSTKQPAVENTPHYMQPASAKRSSNTVVSCQSVGIQAKLPKLVKKQSATRESQAHATQVTCWTDPLAQEPTIQSFSMSLKDWDNLKDDSNTSHMDTSLSGQEKDSTNQPVDGLSDQFAGTVPCEDSNEVAEHISPEEVESYKEYLRERNKRYVCGLCEGYLDTELKCLRHIKNHMKDTHFYCRVCNSEVPSSRYIKSHLHHCAVTSVATEFPGSKYRCVVCKIEFYHKVSLQYHFRRHAEPQHDKYSYLCHPCGKAFVLRPDYIAHKVRVHGIFESLNKPSCNLRCDKCGVKFPTKRALKEHEAKHCDPSVDDECLIID